MEISKLMVAKRNNATVIGLSDFLLNGSVRNIVYKHNNIAMISIILINDRTNVYAHYNIILS